MKTIQILLACSITTTAYAQDSSGHFLSKRHNLSVGTSFNQVNNPVFEYEYNLPKGAIGMEYQTDYKQIYKDLFDPQLPEMNSKEFTTRDYKGRSLEARFLLTLRPHLLQGQLLKNRKYFGFEIDPTIGVGYAVREVYQTTEEITYQYSSETDAETEQENFQVLDANWAMDYRRDRYNGLTFTAGLASKVLISERLYVGAEFQTGSTIYRYHNSKSDGNANASEFLDIKTPITQIQYRYFVSIGANIGRNQVNRSFLL